MPSASLPIVTVLLATYNGGRFLEEQLQSLNAQEGVTVRVLANDDGSTDNTLSILEKWRENGLVHIVTHTDRVGPTKVFLELLYANHNLEFVAFCDQDDIWDPTKLIKQISSIESDMPTLVFTNRDLLTVKGISRTRMSGRLLSPNFQNALVENIAPGNTILLNGSAARLMMQFKAYIPVYYDAWIYLVISTFGKTILIDQELVHYRIHRNNFVGLRSNLNYSYFDSLNNYFNNASVLSESHVGRLEPERQAYLGVFLSMFNGSGKWKRVKSILKVKIYRRKKIHAFGFKAMMLIGIFSNKFKNETRV